MDGRPGGRTRMRVRLVQPDGTRWRSDHVATEEPLEIRLVAGSVSRTIAITMRTPGGDFELAAGFLRGENVVDGRAQIRKIRYCTGPEPDADQQYNVVSVELCTPSLPELAELARHFYTTSACGVCGKANLEALELRGCEAPPPGPDVSAEVVQRLPGRLREAQGLFDSTGGLHAAGLFDAGGEPVCVREDVGRHNAVDKVVGWALLEDRLPLTGHLLVVSGRCSFEIMQKGLVAGVPIVCAVSAPSSLAVATARQFGMTLVGFLRDNRFNVYAGQERIVAR